MLHPKLTLPPLIASSSFQDRFVTLSDLFSDLPSPQPDPSFFSAMTENRRYDHRLRSFLDGKPPDGMRSKLLSYQRESIVAMLQKELLPRATPDPLYVPVVGTDGSTLYMQPETMEMLRERPMVSQNRGGILCEELGTSIVQDIFGWRYNYYTSCRYGKDRDGSRPHHGDNRPALRARGFGS